MDNNNVRKAVVSDSSRIIPSLVRAFEADPFVNWLVTNKKKSKGFNRLFEVSLNILSLPHGEVLTTNNCEGASLWIPSNNSKLGVLKQLSLVPTLMGISGFWGFKQLVGCMDALDKAHPYKEKHYYLLFIGVDPAHQKKGFGSSLMEPIIKKCDEERCGAYLENTNLANENFYKSLGFEIVNEISAGKGAPPLRAMWRKPSN